MKYLGYLTIAFFALLLISFAPIGKHKKPNLPVKDGFGHIQWIQSITYHAIVDSSGAIFKGEVISDTDVDNREPKMGAPVRHHAINEPPIEVWNYDEYGDQIEYAKYHANGMLYDKVTHIYYENGDVRKVIDSSFSHNKLVVSVPQIQQYTYIYDASGKLLTSNKWDYTTANNGNPEFTRTTNKYDSTGKVSEVLTYNTDTMHAESITWKTYNSKGQLVETDERKRAPNAPTVSPFERNDFWYDAKGRMYDKATYHPQIGLVKDEKITFDSTSKTTITYSYGANRVLTGSVEKRVFSERIPLSKAVNTTTQEDTYDAHGLLTDYTISHDSAKHLMDKGVFHISCPSNIGPHATGKCDTIMVHQIVNDNHFNTVENDTFSNDGKPEFQKSYQYTYDSIGNWIEKVEFNNNKPVKVVEREIGYFKD